MAFGTTATRFIGLCAVVACTRTEAAKPDASEAIEQSPAEPVDAPAPTAPAAEPTNDPPDSPATASNVAPPPVPVDPPQPPQPVSWPAWVADCAAWESHPQHPVSFPLTDAVVFDNGDAVFVGPGKASVHRNGKRWSTQPAPGTLWRIWGTSPDDLFAAGGTHIYRYDGVQWTMVLEGTVSFTDIWGASSSDVFVTARDGRIAHFDGERWEPTTVDANTPLFALWGTASDNVYAVGDAGLVLRYDGATWEPQDLHSTDAFTAVSGSGPDDVYVLGTSLRHFDGAAWSVTREPAGEERFADVHAVARDDVLLTLVGYASDLETPEYNVLHFDGEKWRSSSFGGAETTHVASAPNGTTMVFGTGDDIFRFKQRHVTRITRSVPRLSAAFAPSPGEILGVNEIGDVSRFHERTWNELPSLPDRSTPLGVFSSDGVAFVASRRDRALFVHQFVEGQWREILKRSTPLERLGIWGTSPTNVYVAGADSLGLHYDGTSWSEVALPAGAVFTGVWGRSANDIYAFGKRSASSSGILVHFDGRAWTVVEHPATGPINAIWAWRDVVFVAAGAFDDDFGDTWGSTGSILRFDGSVWSKLLDKPMDGEVFAAVWGNSDRDVFFLSSVRNGDGGYDYSSHTLLHYDGDKLEPLTAGEGAAWFGTSSQKTTKFGGDFGLAVLRCHKPRGKTR